MAPVLHLVRHAQGMHNLGFKYIKLPDPNLTDLGHEQCANLRLLFADQSRISLVTASPLTRTIQTAYFTFKPALENGSCKPTIIALPDTQEVSYYPCNIGLDVNLLSEKCISEGWPVDLSNVSEGWNDKSSRSRYSASPKSIAVRAKAARRQLRELARGLVAAGNPNPEIVLVTHGGFLHWFTDDWENYEKHSGTGWHNCEMRSYTYEAGIDSNDKVARLVETQESRLKRGRVGAVADETEQTENVRDSKPECSPKLNSTIDPPNMPAPSTTDKIKGMT